MTDLKNLKTIRAIDSSLNVFVGGWCIAKIRPRYGEEKTRFIVEECRGLSTLGLFDSEEEALASLSRLLRGLPA